MKYTESKSALSSTTIQSGIIGAVISVLTIIVNASGLDWASEYITPIITGVATLITSIIAIVGRYKADKKIG